jgi:hypothetical protein
MAADGKRKKIDEEGRGTQVEKQAERGREAERDEVVLESFPPFPSLSFSSLL